jgi:hypothetical protein
MPIVAKLDEYGKGAWIAFAVLGFIIFWPLGLATLAFLFWSGRMGHGCGPARYEHRMNRLQEKMERLRERMGSAQEWGSRGGFGGWGRGPSSSGNRAFDEYRDETLRRLEDEQREFHDFLGRLRMAKDKAEFDEFMSERRRGNTGTDTVESA